MSVATPRPRGGLTSRATLLGLVVMALVLLVALPLRSYVEQRAQISTLQRQQQEQQHRLALLREQAARVQDPTYVQHQARERLHDVLPGETDYVIVDPPTKAPAKRIVAPAQPGTVAPVVPTASGPWWTRLWDSDGVAGRASH